MSSHNDDPNMHWDGTRWLRWDGSQWTDATTGTPVAGGDAGEPTSSDEHPPPADPTEDPSMHWDGTRWLRWDGSQWTDATTGDAIGSAQTDQSELAPEAVGGQPATYGRADVDAAAERMGFKLGSKREIKKLVEHLWDGETVEFLASGTYGGGGGLLALTDRRLIFLRDAWTSKVVEDFPIDKISSVQWKSGMLTGSVLIFVSGNKSEIGNVQKDAGKALTDSVRSKIAGLNQMSAPTAAAAAAAQDVDPMEQITKLGALRDAGLLTDEEFTAKKAELLDRM